MRGGSFSDDPYWKAQIAKDLPTFRKFNAHLVLATQSPESVVTSSLSARFLDNTASNIFFANPNANFEKHYCHFNISDAEFAFIKNTLPERRLFLYKQASGSAICKLNLTGMDDEMAVLSGNSATVKLLDSIRAEVGDNPNDWLPIFQQRRRVQTHALSSFIFFLSLSFVMMVYADHHASRKL